MISMILFACWTGIIFTTGFKVSEMLYDMDNKVDKTNKLLSAMLDEHNDNLE